MRVHVAYADQSKVKSHVCACESGRKGVMEERKGRASSSRPNFPAWLIPAHSLTVTFPVWLIPANSLTVRAEEGSEPFAPRRPRPRRGTRPHGGQSDQPGAKSSRGKFLSKGGCQGSVPPGAPVPAFAWARVMVGPSWLHHKSGTPGLRWAPATWLARRPLLRRFRHHGRGLRAGPR